MLCLITGCFIADIDECLDGKKYPCLGVCTNTYGSFACDCPRVAEEMHLMQNATKIPSLSEHG